MFWDNFKASIGVLPWLFLVPLGVCIIFITVAGPWIEEYGYSMRREGNAVDWNARDGSDNSFGTDEGLEYDEEFAEDFGGDFFSELDGSLTVYRWKYYRARFIESTIFAVIINFLFLLIIPCASSYNADRKKRQFRLGFFIHFAAFAGIPFIYYLVYELDHTTLIILLGLHVPLYMGTFLPGARYVSPSYRKAFWF
jgi:hypothetical protein